MTEIQFAKDLSVILAHVRELTEAGDPCDFHFVEFDGEWHATIRGSDDAPLQMLWGVYQVSDPDPVRALRKLAEMLYD